MIDIRELCKKNSPYMHELVTFIFLTTKFQAVRGASHANPPTIISWFFSFYFGRMQKKCCRFLQLCSFALFKIPTFPSSSTTKCRRCHAESPQCSSMVAIVLCRFVAGCIGVIVCVTVMFVCTACTSSISIFQHSSVSRPSPC